MTTPWLVVTLVGSAGLWLCFASLAAGLEDRNDKHLGRTADYHRENYWWGFFMWPLVFSIFLVNVTLSRVRNARVKHYSGPLGQLRRWVAES